MEIYIYIYIYISLMCVCVSLEEEMAANSSILARRIPWTKEPGRLQSMGCKELNMTEVM